MNVCFKKIDALRVQKSGISGQIGDRVAESGGFDPCLLLNDEIGCAAALRTHMRSEPLKVLDHVKRDFWIYVMSWCSCCAVEEMNAERSSCGDVAEESFQNVNQGFFGRERGVIFQTLLWRVLPSSV